MKKKKFSVSKNRKNELLDFVKNIEKREDSKLVVLYVKIDHYDDFEECFGLRVSSKLQNIFSKELYNMMPKECYYDKVFALDGGVFAFVKRKNAKFNEGLAARYIKKFQSNVRKSKIHFKHIDYDIAIIASLAYGVSALDNARCGLKVAEDSKQNFIIANGIAPALQKHAAKNLKTLQMVKGAIENNRIISYFQSIVNNRTKKIEKYESLVRLVDKDSNVITPISFLDIAKKGKYYAQITSIVLDNSFNALNVLETDVSINLSIIDIEKKSTRKKILNLLNRHKENASRIIFELLEDENVKDFTVILSFIKYVKSLGVQIAIDDFGSGYSNFSRLLEYEPDIVKLDGSLIKNVLTDNFSLEIVKTIVSFAQTQKIQVVAEFVENREIYECLSEIGVDYSQGYYFDKPKSLEAILGSENITKPEGLS